MKKYTHVNYDGNEMWYYENNVLHREDGPAIITANGYRAWILNGELHREEGPAVILGNGYKEWRYNGLIHREDGPARIWIDGYKEWWLNGFNLKKEKWWESLSDEWKVKALFYGE